MKDNQAREMREVREMQATSGQKANRALAAILEVSVEFADVQRRLDVLHKREREGSAQG